MTNEQKILIADALEAYMSEHGLSQQDVMNKSGVNAAYIIAIRKKEFAVKTTPIADKWYRRLAALTHFSLEKSYWQTQPTPQLKIILATLKEAKDNGEVAVLTGETGCGKSYTCELFAQKNPADVYIIKVGAADNLSDLIDKVSEALKLNLTIRSKSGRLRAISKHIRKLSEDGHEPVIIFDEAEYMKQPALCALKELYDALNTWCALVLIGTEQLTINIEKLRRKNKAGIPQLYRRIRYKIRALPGIDRNFKEFLNGIEPGLKKWLQRNCDNYGELHDVLVPAMREAERTGENLSEDFVKLILGIAV